MSTNNENGVSRRGFITGIAAGTAAVAVASPVLAATSRKTSAGSPHMTDAAPGEPVGSLQDLSAPLRDVFAALVPGAAVLPGWTIDRVGLRTGAVAVFVRSEAGEELRVDVCRRDDARESGVVRTERFELVVMNHGEGTAATQRDHELAARVIGEALRRSEGALTSAPTELATHERRVALFQHAMLFHPEPARRA